ncbi:MAG TPA: hypothetical protein VLZ74_13730 [Methylocella sp.]|nr:hypothetical protein [Methylocella sp.]
MALRWPRFAASSLYRCLGRGRSRTWLITSNQKATHVAETNASRSILACRVDTLLALICVACEATPLARLINSATLCELLVGIANQPTITAEGTSNMVKATTKKAVKKGAAKKSAAKKASVKKSAPKKAARKAVAKKRPVKKAAAKKGSVKKAAAKKSTRKATAKKAGAKKVVRKSAARKPPPPPPPTAPESA